MQTHRAVNSLPGFLVVLFAAVGAAFMNVLAPMVYGAGSNPPTLIFVRYVFFLGVCLIFVSLARQSLRLPRRQLMHCYIAGTLYTMGASALLFAFALIPVSLTVLIFFTFPILTLIIESLLDRERPTLWAIICALGAFSGLVLALSVNTEQLNAAGIGLAGLAALGLSSSYIWSNRTLQGVSPAVTTFHMALASLVFAAILLATTGNFLLPAQGGTGPYLFLAAVIVFALVFAAQFLGVKLVGARGASMTMNLEPVFTIGLAVMLLSEKQTTHQLIGAAIVIGSVALSQLKPRSRADFVKTPVLNTLAITDRPLLGMALMAAAMLIMPARDGIAKLLTGEYPPLVVAWSTYVVAGILILPFATRYFKAEIFIPRILIPQLARTVFLVCAVSLFYLAIARVPLADALGAFFISPVVGTILAVIFLKEPLGWIRAGAVILGFIGALLIIRPGINMDPGMLYAIGAGVAFGCYIVSTRKAARDIHPLLVLAIQNVFGALLLSPFYFLSMPEFSNETLALIGLMGLIAIASHYMSVSAFRYAPASVLSPMIYFEIIGGVIIGYVMFTDLPSPMTWAGIATICTAGLILMHAEHRSKR